MKSVEYMNIQSTFITLRSTLYNRKGDGSNCLVILNILINISGVIKQN